MQFFMSSVGTQTPLGEGMASTVRRVGDYSSSKPSFAYRWSGATGIILRQDKDNFKEEYGMEVRPIRC